MVRNEFEDFLIDMGHFFERSKAPNSRTIDLWFEKIKAIPAESLKWITKKIQDEYEIWPRNITATLWAFYHQWLDAHPEKRAIETFFNCSDCDEGLITAYKKKNDIKYRYVFRCSKCRQDHTKAYPIAARLELMNDGYEIRPKVQ
jgi:hypothetical protein